MKKIALLAAVACALTMSACNNNSSADKNHDGDTTVGEHLDHTIETTEENVDAMQADANAELAKAEENAKQAQADLDAAIKSGDKKAQEAAQKALDDANAAWEKN
jgi:Skp family chaperone for outer membrane proteins